jgi:hypothetical protein
MSSTIVDGCTPWYVHSTNVAIQWSTSHECKPSARFESPHIPRVALSMGPVPASPSRLAVSTKVRWWHYQQTPQPTQRRESACSRRREDRRLSRTASISKRFHLLRGTNRLLMPDLIQFRHRSGSVRASKARLVLTEMEDFADVGCRHGFGMLPRFLSPPIKGAG